MFYISTTVFDKTFKGNYLNKIYMQYYFYMSQIGTDLGLFVLYLCQVFFLFHIIFFIFLLQFLINNSKAIAQTKQTCRVISICPKFLIDT